MQCDLRSQRSLSSGPMSYRRVSARCSRIPAGSLRRLRHTRMTDALYQELILDHNRKPKNFRVMEHADRELVGHNPLCGDQLTLWLKLDGDRIADVSFQGQGCAISKASASLMTTAVKGKSREEAEVLFTRFHDLVTGKLLESEAKELGSLRAFGGVS